MAGLGLWQLGGGLYIHAKAALAQALLSEAWAETLVGHERARPWPWADTWPVARLQVPSLGIDQIVLAGSNGRTLAFGPGHMRGTAAPGGPGHAILGGHRDTHFAFLAELRLDSELRLQRPDGTWRHYRVTGTSVIDSREAAIGHDNGRSVLTLVTCYPFDAVEAGGPLRYLVQAEAYTETVQVD
jgi:sortase A